MPAGHPEDRTQRIRPGDPRRAEPGAAGCLGRKASSSLTHKPPLRARRCPAGRQPPRAMAAEPADEDVERHVRKRFEVCQRLGKGAYGVVWKAIERRSRSTVALKKCFDAFRNGAISAF